MWESLIPAGVGFLGSFLSNQSAADRVNSINDQAFQQFIKTKIPDIAEQQLALQQYASAGKLTPALQQAIQQSPSEFQNVMASQQDKAAQNNALSQLEQIGNAGGMRLQDKTSLQEAMLANQAKDAGARGALMNQMQQRGQAGSGFELQAALQGQQAAADRDAQSGLSVAAQAQNRALQAIQQSGQLAGQYRAQDVNEQAQRAQAQDTINQFNARNLQNVQGANTQALNQAQQYNLGNQQAIMNKNADIANQQQMYNKGLYQQQFNNQMEVNNALAGQYGRQAQAAQQQGQQNSQMWSNLGQAGVGIANAYNQGQQNDKWLQAYKDKQNGDGGSW